MSVPITHTPEAAAARREHRPPGLYDDLQMVGTARRAVRILRPAARNGVHALPFELWIIGRSTRRRRRNRASALLMVLWAIAILSVSIMGVIELISLDLDETTLHAKIFRARQLAESGLAVAQHPNIAEGDPLLQQSFSGGESFRVAIHSENQRLNMNTLLAADQRKFIAQLFVKWGLNADDANAVSDCLLDWVDPDDLHHLNGAERDYYTSQGHPEFPPNRPFESVEEMKFVRGMDVVAEKKPNWKSYFTIWTDGKIDVNEASTEMIEVICGITPQQAKAITNRRLGADLKPGTKDDYRYQEVGEIRFLLGMAESSFQSISDRLTIQSEIQRIESTGKVGDYECKVVIVTRRNSNPIQILTWLEP